MCLLEALLDELDLLSMADTDCRVRSLNCELLLELLFHALHVGDRTFSLDMVLTIDAIQFLLLLRIHFGVVVKAWRFNCINYCMHVKEGNRLMRLTFLFT